MLARDRKAAQGRRTDTSPGADSVCLFGDPCSEREHISRKKMDNEVKYCQGRGSGKVGDFFSAQIFKQFILLFKRLKKKPMSQEALN